MGIRKVYSHATTGQKGRHAVYLGRVVVGQLGLAGSGVGKALLGAEVGLEAVGRDSGQPAAHAGPNASEMRRNTAPCPYPCRRR